MNSDGSGATPVTRLTNADDQRPTFSPDGTHLAFLSDRALDGSDASVSANNIWVMKAGGSGAIPLTRYTAFNVDSIFSPFWSPDGKKVAFESTAALDGSDSPNTSVIRNLWVANIDGSGATPLTHLVASNSKAIGAFPTGCSPDGSSIAFTSDAALDGAVDPSFQNAWVIKADGTDSRRLTLAGSGWAAWKP